MNCLIGQSIKPKTAKQARELIGKQVTYLRNVDIDRSGRGYFFPQYGTVNDVHGRNMQIGEDWIYISSLEEMVEDCP